MSDRAWLRLERINGDDDQIDLSACMPAKNASTQKRDVHASPTSIFAPSHDLPPLSLLPPTRNSTTKQRHNILASGSIILALVAPLLTRLLHTADIAALTADIAELTADIPWAVLIAGFAAQLVDGSLGMGFGITSATVLTSLAGLSPTLASTAVHFAQLGTTAVSGYAHRRCGNLHTPTLHMLSPAGVLGALIGSMLLSSLDVATSKLASGTTLFAVGLYVLLRFARSCASVADGADGADGGHAPTPLPSVRFLAPLGLVGGCVDAMGGGGWGPIVTSGLLAEGRLPPSTAIGTVSLSEFFVTLSAVLGFLLVLGPSHATPAQLRLDLALALLVGGTLAAPVAPLLVRRIQPHKLGMLVGAFICLTNARAPLRLATRLAG